MHIKFLAHGTGDPHRAVNYLLADKDHNGMLRPEVIVLRGNPSAVANVAASLDSVHRYTSAVIAWAPEDQPTSDEVDAVVDDFERLAFAGLEADEVSYSVVRHGDHLHVIVARVNLRTGKAINIAPPVWRKHFDHLRDHWNYKLGWGHPGDPARSRLLQANGDEWKEALGKQRRVEAMSAETELSVSDILGVLGEPPSLKQIIADRLEYLVQSAVIHDRKDVLRVLEEYGSINRKGRDYLSLKPHGDDKPIRFKGAMFREDFAARDFLVQRRSPSTFTRASPNPSAAEKALQEMEEAILRRADYYARRSGPAHDKTADLADVQSLVDETANSTSPEPTSGDQSDDGNRNPVVEELQRYFDASRSAVQKFIRSCLKAVGGIRAAERAIDGVQRAIDTAKRAGLDAQQASFDARARGSGVERPVDTAPAGGAVDKLVSETRSITRTRKM